MDVISPNGFTTAMPALLTNRSSGSFPTAAIRSDTPDGIARSWISRTTSAQRDLTFLHTFAKATVSRPWRNNVVSGAASFSAMARPIPRLAPVIKYRFMELLDRERYERQIGRASCRERVEDVEGRGRTHKK